MHFFMGAAALVLTAGAVPRWCLVSTILDLCKRRRDPSKVPVGAGFHAQGSVCIEITGTHRGMLTHEAG